MNKISATLYTRTSKLKKDLLQELLLSGELIVTRSLETVEITGINFTIIPRSEKLNSEQEQYVTNKIREIDQDLLDCWIKLKRDSSSRQAVIQFTQKTNTLELPNCIVSIQFLVRNNRLEILVFQRSLDIINKLKQDVEFVRRIGKILNKTLNIKKIRIKYFVGSVHYYCKEQGH